MVNRRLVRISLTLMFILASMTYVYGNTDVWVTYVTSEGGWKTSVSVYYTGAEASPSFTFIRMGESGNFLEDPVVLPATDNMWNSIPDSSLGYNGSARILSNSNLLVKVSYRYGESQSLCEFYLAGDTGQDWVVPSTAHPWFDWTGIALVNSSDAPATMVLEAWNQGVKVGSQSTTLAARSRSAKTSNVLWNGLAPGQFDTAVVRSSVPIPPPISITGNRTQDRHVFFTARPRPQNERALYLVNGTLIDGTGREPVGDAIVGIRNGRILTVGRGGEITIPGDADILDAQGGFILPGFINAHVHNAFNLNNLRTWAQAGVTTVRDVGAAEPPSVAFRFRDSVRSDLSCARLVAAGPLVTVPGGYPASVGFPAMTVTSPEDARVKITGLLDQGADLIKITIEDGLRPGFPGTAWPTLTPAEVLAIVETAHGRAIPVTAHINFTKYLQIGLDAGVDDCVHSVFDPLPDRMIQQMLRSKMAVVPTLLAQDRAAYTVSNLRRFVEAGGKVAMGNDGGYVAGLEIGMPITELEAMQDAGMTPMQIIVASTKNAAEVCKLDRTLGTLEFDKAADILIVRGNPLENLRVLMDVERVIHGGAVIR